MTRRGRAGAGRTWSGRARPGRALAALLLLPALLHAAPCPPDDQVAAALAALNQLRAGGLVCGERPFGPAPPLTWSAPLAAVAAGYARELAQRGQLAHADANGQLGGDRLQRAGYAWQRWAENLAAGPRSAESSLQWWATSPGHCAQLMDGRLQQAGLACAEARGRPYWVLMLATPR